MKAPPAFFLLLLLLPVTGCEPPRRPPRLRPRRLPPQPLSGRWIRAKPGQSLALIALQTRTPVADLEELNGIDRRRVLKIERRIFLPRPAVATTRQRRARRPTANVGLLRWPVERGKLSSRFGPRGKRPHEGIDIAAPEGSAIFAALAGKVIYAGSKLRGYGNIIILRHKNDLVTVYAHNKRNLVREGMRVERGQIIAEVGQSGKATAPHVHFEVRKGETPLDPLRFVSPPPK